MAHADVLETGKFDLKETAEFPTIIIQNASQHADGAFDTAVTIPPSGWQPSANGESGQVRDYNRTVVHAENQLMPQNRLGSFQTLVPSRNASFRTEPADLTVAGRLASFRTEPATISAGPSRLASFRTEPVTISAAPSRLASFRTDYGEEYMPTRGSFHTLPPSGSFSEEQSRAVGDRQATFPSHQQQMPAPQWANTGTHSAAVPPTRERLLAHEISSAPKGAGSVPTPWWAAR
eukprot:TRINITY_DN48497_c0_g1_i1.p1 TRINITY_DN48497_c0_g1~~TRINITY_DN48497_c0_g1_i1.p1  ORF type:complete len:253 (-),score=28.50 TRINITY_DN48497_c0_g1_i1:24-725(-)